MATESLVHIEQVHPSLSVPEVPLRQLIALVLAGEQKPLGFFGVILGDHALVLELNRSHLNHDYLTDVLSFSLTDDPNDPLEGEVYVDLDTAAERHAEFDATFEEETYRYVIHGLLHLIGYTDKTPETKAEMHAREDHYLAQLAALSAE